jgi:hypothetical protein
MRLSGPNQARKTDETMSINPNLTGTVSKELIKSTYQTIF